MLTAPAQAEVQGDSFAYAKVLYGFAFASTLVTLYVLGPILNYDFGTWTTYYRSIGELSRYWGYLFGSVLIAISGFLVLRSLLVSSLQDLVLRLSPVERLLLALFAANLLWCGVGLAMGNPPSFVLGDTFKGSFIPVIYWIVKKSTRSIGAAMSLARTIIVGETILLAILVPTGFIPFSFAGRTFLSTVFFTMLFEEKKSGRRIAYILGLAAAIVVMLTTSAVRGIIIIFIIIVLLNYFFRLREIRLRVVLFAFLMPAIGLLGANELFELKLDTEVSAAADRFSGSIGERGRARYFGLDESLFQRVGEAIDVGRTFMGSAPIFVVSGFGNGAMLDNTLITPSEYTVYKSRAKHQIYITPVAILFRYGLLGILLYGGIVTYVARTLLMLRRNRLLLRDRPEAMYLKVLLLYQVSVVLMSLVSYWYIGNFIVAFTLALVEILRRGLVEECNISVA